MVENKFKEEVNELFDRRGQSSAFEYDTFDWGCLRYMLELWIFLNRISKEGIMTIRSFFNATLAWLSGNEELRRYDGQDYSAASMLSFFLFVKLARMKIEEALDFLSSNKSCMKLMGLEKVPTKGAVTKFRERMGADFNRFFGDLIAHITDCMNFDDLERHHVILFTKCYFGDRRFPRMSKGMESLKFTRINKKIRRTATKWAGFNLMLYVLYGLGIVNILEDMKVEKRSNCVYTPLQISLSYIVKIILGFKNAYGLDEELEDDIFLQMICTLDGDRTPSKSTLDEDIRRYKEEELRKAYQAIIQWMKILGFVAGEIVAGDSSKIYVDGKTYEGSEEVYDYLKKENVKGYKLFVIYDVVYRIPIYFEVRGINDADGPSLKEMVEKAMEITGKRIKRVYIDRGFYDEANFRWLDEKEHIEYVTRGKKGTEFYEQAAELGADEFRELKTKEYEPKTARGKAAKQKRDEEKKPVKVAELVCSFSDGSPVRVVVEKKRARLSRNEKLLILLEKLSGSYTAQEILDLYKKEYGAEFSNSKNLATAITKTLKRIPAIEVIGKRRGRRYKIEGYKAGIEVLEGNEKEEMLIWLTNVFDVAPEQVIEDYGNRWRIETLFEEAKGEWYINKLPSRDLEPIKVHFYFSFIAYDIVNIFKRALTEKYRNAGIEVLRRDVLHKIAVISFNGKSVKFEFNKKYEIRYNEQLASINEFINRTRDKIEFVEFDALA
ncbi:hypothetical protein DRN97_06905 [Methanosarcinales archaeon]|nr:MAG: hypothetical protein DRN97_06905 [Methanosarcinales archaeon]